MKFGRRTLVVLLALAAYLAVVGCAPVLDQLVLFPSTYGIAPGTAVRKAIAFEGGELEVWTAQSTAARERGQPDMYLLRFYGNADRAERWVAEEADMFGDRAIEVWGMNYPGYGGSTGPARLARIGPAAATAFDELKRQARERPVFVFGASLGGTAALHLAATRPIAGLILHNPPALRQMILGQFGWWNLWLLAGPLSRKVPAELDSIANANASRAPAVFLLAEHDEVVAPRFQRLVAEAYAGEKRVIHLRGATHNSPIEAEGLRSFQEALDWLMPGE
ncbi:MAG TPA: alpha/beta fold hydrolase [Chthoniobacterales bacterium]|nr:alpha/beta fold hydrolase [Chthoniobacterales bacterium]